MGVWMFAIVAAVLEYRWLVDGSGRRVKGFRGS
jgi:hypothetical protein